MTWFVKISSSLSWVIIWHTYVVILYNLWNISISVVFLKAFMQLVHNILVLVPFIIFSVCFKLKLHKNLIQMFIFIKAESIETVANQGLFCVTCQAG